MPEEPFSAVERLYHAALDMEAEQQSAFLDEACGGDDLLRIEVQTF
jgi:hypothetical protein